MRTTSRRTADSSRRSTGGALWLAPLFAAAVTAAALGGCGDDAESDDPSGTGATGASSSGTGTGGGGPAAHEVVEGVAREGSTPPTAVSDLGVDVTVAGVVHADAAFGTADGAFRVTLATGEIADVDLYDDESGELLGAGEVRAMARRADGGVFVATPDGLFHDQDGVLLRSPFQPGEIVSLDARASSLGDEELWIVGGGEARHVGDTVDTVAIEGFAIDLLVGVGDARAVAVSGGTLLSLDLVTAAATIEESELGSITAMSRAEDGTVWVASDAGLVRRAPDGGTTRFTLAAVGAAAVPVHAVAAAYGAVAAITDVGLIGVDAEGPFVIDATVTAATTLTIDGAGDVWTTSGTELTRHATGQPVTFASSVAPLLANKCAVCHEAGVDNAPVLDLADYDEVVLLAPDLVERATSASSPMPPTGLLAASESAPLLRWIATGLAP